MDNISRQFAVIMAGGSGERFWPLSRRSRPKQLLSLADGKKTLLEQVVANISPHIPVKQVFLATGDFIAEAIRETHSDIPPENILTEPFKRNTAGCLVFTAAHLLARYGGDGSDITMAVFPADHHIGNPEKFGTVIKAALAVAEKESALVTVGITPNRPETGYGYLETAATPLSGSGSIPVFPVLRFCEKPDLKTAKEYIATDRFFWNSGLFFWRLSVFIEELDRVAPEMCMSLKNMAEALGNNDRHKAMAIFKKLDNISIDYALMEKSKSVLAVSGDFGWDDVGAWDALERTFPGDEEGNVTVGEPILVDTRNSIVYNESGAEDMAVAVIGIEGLAVIVSDDGVLVVPKDRAQDVRKVVEELKKRNAKQL
ncbi:MAG: NTP transferase domain-containing protein [Candidatus Latescibacteria bacterium]|jgi:mannose-1-phosphate guanylyltransferase|nr:NTP transferase domain-containing protein [Candidatus Latescibacterota bacterium]